MTPHIGDCPRSGRSKTLLSGLDISLGTHWHQIPKREPTFPEWRLNCAAGPWFGGSHDLVYMCIDMKSEDPVSEEEEIGRGGR